MKLTVIADEVTALGWRLIGAEVQVPGPIAAQHGFREALRSADVVLITAEYAREISASQLHSALMAAKPLVLVIADLRHRHEEPPEIEDVARRVLGISA
jgi:vacuolar-type H+-ATPase subunit F/Vma7